MSIHLVQTAFELWQFPVGKIAEKAVCSFDNMALYFEFRINKNAFFCRFCSLGSLDVLGVDTNSQPFGHCVTIVVIFSFAL